MTEYSVERARSLTQEQLHHLAEKVATSFDRDETSAGIFSDHNDMAVFYETYIEFYLKAGEVHLCRDEADTVCGAALWMPPGKELFTEKGIHETGMDGTVAHMMQNLSPASISRMAQSAATLQDLAYTKPHYYLCVIAAFRAGAGSALMHYALERFGEQDIYLENSSPTGNHAFYEKFGFENMLSDLPKQCPVMPMLRKGTPANN